MTKRTKLMTTVEAAAHLRVSPRILERLRLTDKGPKYLRVGRRVWYRRADLDEWHWN